jgi:murein DD-endopeptidase MepM/ murein hydrolase activator NlpD
MDRSGGRRCRARNREGLGRVLHILGAAAIGMILMAALVVVHGAEPASASTTGSGYLPFPKGFVARVEQGNFGSYSHNNAYNYYAWDFVAASGSIAGEPVLSSTNGTVVYARNTMTGQVTDFNSCFAAGNFVIVDNHDGTFTQYLHMGYLSERVKAGDPVRVGNVIGTVGNTGFTGGAYHLHTQWLYKLTSPTCGIGYSTPGTYLGVGVPQPGQLVTSNNPGASAVAPVVVDDRSSGFSLYGPSAYWHQYSGGYASHFWWTYTNGSTVSNYAIWKPSLPVSGNWTVYVFVPSPDATTTSARYRITYFVPDNLSGGGDLQSTTRIINQNNYYNTWVPLATEYFKAGTSGFVTLTDQTYETSPKQIGFDAIKFVKS